MRIRTLVLAVFVVCAVAQTGATTFRSVQPGAWENPDTWGGVAPSLTITSDAVVIAHTVSAANPIVLNGTQASLAIESTLELGIGNTLTLLAGGFEGAGKILGGTIVLAYPCNTPVVLPLQLTISSRLEIGDCDVDIRNRPFRTHGPIGGTGKFLVNEGTFFEITHDATGFSGVDYGSICLKGPGVAVFHIDLGEDGRLGLGCDLTTFSDLHIESGALELLSNTLTSQGACVTTGRVVIDSASTIHFGGNHHSSTPMQIHGVLGELVVDIKDENIALLAGEFTVASRLDLRHGTLEIASATLTIMGDVVSGSGLLLCQNEASVFVRRTQPLSAALRFSNRHASPLLKSFGIMCAPEVRIRIEAETFRVVDELYMAGGILEFDSTDVHLQGRAKETGASPAVLSTTAKTTINVYDADVVDLRFVDGDTLGKLILFEAPYHAACNIKNNVYIDRGIESTVRRIHVGDNTLTLGANGHSSMYPHIVLSESGRVVHKYLRDNTMVFAVGTESALLPLVVFMPDRIDVEEISVRVRDGVYAHGTSGNRISDFNSCVAATWIVEQVGGARYPANVMMGWSHEKEVHAFDSDVAYVSQYTGNGWLVGQSTRRAVDWTDSVRFFQGQVVDSLGPLAVFDNRTTQVVEDALGAPQASTSLRLSPNPVSDVLTLTLPLGTSDHRLAEFGATSGQQVTISDAHGRVVYEGASQGAALHDHTQVFHIDVSAIAPGVYFASTHRSTARRAMFVIAR